MKKQKKIFCGVAALLLAALIALSVAFVAKEADHTCPADDCRICRQISVCLNLLNSASSASGAVFSSTAVFAVLFVIGVTRQSAVNSSLIKMKVKLSN